MQVLDLLKEPTLLTEALKEVGLSWKLTGDFHQGSRVKSQPPFPDKFVLKGAVVDLYYVNGPRP